MDSQSTPALEKVGGTKITRRTVTRGVAWSVPVAAVAYHAPAFAASQPPVLAGQCGTACKHPGTGQNDKAYHFTFCFKTGSLPIKNNEVTLLNMQIGADTRPAFSGENDTTVTVVPNDTVCYFVDAPFFDESSSDEGILNFQYTVINPDNSETVLTGCARATIIGDVCGTGQPPLSLQPKNWPHDNGAGDPGVEECNPNPGDC